MTKETKDRIAKEASEARVIYVKEEVDFDTPASAVSYMGLAFKDGYIAGAEAEAERALPLLDHLTKIRDHLPENDVIRIRLTEVLTAYSGK